MHLYIYTQRIFCVASTTNDRELNSKLYCWDVKLFFFFGTMSVCCMHVKMASGFLVSTLCCMNASVTSFIYVCLGLFSHHIQRFVIHRQLELGKSGIEEVLKYMLNAMCVWKRV